MFRDLLFSVRPIVGEFATSFRATPITHNTTTISNEGYFLLNQDNHTQLVNKINKIVNQINHGTLQEYAKINLPIMTNTTYIATFDIRTFANLLHTIELHNFDYYLYMNKDNDINDRYLPKVKCKDLYEDLCILDSEKKSGKVGSMNYIYTTVTINLAGQIIRKHDAKIKSQLWNMFLSDNPPYELTCADKIQIGIYITDSQLRQMCSTRTCWFARFDQDNEDSWTHILKDYVNSMTDKDFISQLPCQGNPNKCLIKADMRPRCQRKEPAPPCAILLENPDLLEERIEIYESKGAIINKWKEIKKYIKYNPDNEYNKEYYETKSN